MPDDYLLHVLSDSCDRWPEHLGSAAEVLLLTLLGTHKEALAPRVIEALQRASAACPPGADLANLPGEFKVQCKLSGDCCFREADLGGQPSSGVVVAVGAHVRRAAMLACNLFWQHSVP
jgi:hypothetical protein